MLKIILLLGGIVAVVGAGIFLFCPDRSSPFQLMEWDSFFVEKEYTGVESKQSKTTVLNSGLPRNQTALEITEEINYQVPFTAQAPFGEWDNERYQDGCEEACVLMAIKAVKNEDLNRAVAKKEIDFICDYELDNYSSFIDTSASATLARIVVGYFKYMGHVEYGIDQADIIEALRGHNLVIVPTDGTKLNNPYYSPPGPKRHMLLIKGYDSRSSKFICNDPGTRHGQNYKYDTDVLINALSDYPSGDHAPDGEKKRAMIVIPL
jgi:hypothetical protein